MRIILAFILLIMPYSTFAKSIDLNVGDDSFRFIYASGIDKNLVTDFGLLFLEAEGRQGDDELAFHAGLNFVAGNVRFGGRAFLVSPGDYDTLSVGFGGQVRIPVASSVGIGGHFYYAPESTSFMDSAGYHEYRINLDVELTRSVYLYLGYRNVKVRIEDRRNKVELNDDVIFGFKTFF